MSNPRLFSSQNTLSYYSNSQTVANKSSSLTSVKYKTKTGKPPIKPYSRCLYQDPNTGQFYLLPIVNESVRSVARTIEHYLERNAFPAIVSAQDNIILIKTDEIKNYQQLIKLFSKVVMQSILSDAEKSQPSNPTPQFSRQLFYDASKGQYYLLPYKNEPLDRIKNSLNYYLKKNNLNASASENIKFDAVIIHLHKSISPKQIENLFINPPIHKLLSGEKYNNILPQNRKLYYDSLIQKLYITPTKYEKLDSLARTMKNYLHSNQCIDNIYANHEQNVIYIDLVPNATFACIESFFADKIISQSINPIKSPVTTSVNTSSLTANSNKRKFSLINSNFFHDASTELNSTPNSIRSFHGNFMHQPLPTVDQPIENPTPGNNPHTIFYSANAISNMGNLFTKNDFDEFNKAQETFGEALENYKDDELLYSTPVLT